MLGLIRWARRRFFCNRLFAEGANALSVALVAIILLLLLGTQILDWRWLLPITALALATAVYRARRKTPAAYTVAQFVDHRMGLADTLSTALYYSGPGSSRVSPAVVECQLARANRLAAGVDVRRAVPYTLPRTIYPMFALFLVASSLFALRYGLSRRLDLKPPLAQILQQRFDRGQQTQQADARRPDPPPPPPQEEYAESEEDSARSRTRPDHSADREAVDTSNQQESRSKADGSRRQERQQSSENQKPGGNDEEAGSQERSASRGSNQAGSNRQGEGNRKQAQQAGKPDDAGGSGQDSSLLSKVKDAMQNLLSRMKPQSGAGGSEPQSALNQKGGQSKGRQNGGKQPSSNDGQPNTGEQGDQGQRAQSAESVRNASGQGAGKSDSRQPGKQPGSGIGNQDGAKEIREAEQLAAMGKISEIIGKRSANITGEATVEVQSTSQQLHTAYADRRAQHSETGSEISRDEVPVALQPYVQQYFEQVRKQAAAKK